MNKQLISQLDILKENSENIYKARAFETASNSIGGLNYNVARNKARFLRDADELTGVGAGIRARILEFIEKGFIEEAQIIIERNGSIDALIKIKGVGVNLAHKWIDADIYNIADLRRAIREGRVKLTQTQEYGLRYYTELNKPILRGVITAYVARLSANLAIDLTIAGSYRRGAKKSGDIDLLILGKSIAKYIGAIEEMDEHIYTISAGSHNMTYIAKYSGRVFQCDVIITEDYVPALVYFTGSKQFNIHMRKRAKSLGYKLNQYGLWNGTKKIKLRDERDLFAKLDMRYVVPEKR
jgi:DNA polymerase/3'-5' exonuclease PolX